MIKGTSIALETDFEFSDVGAGFVSKEYSEVEKTWKFPHFLVYSVRPNPHLHSLVLINQILLSEHRHFQPSDALLFLDSRYRPLQLIILQNLAPLVRLNSDVRVGRSGKYPLLLGANHRSATSFKARFSKGWSLHYPWTRGDFTLFLLIEWFCVFIIVHATAKKLTISGFSCGFKAMLSTILPMLSPWP